MPRKDDLALIISKYGCYVRGVCVYHMSDMQLYVFADNIRAREAKKQEYIDADVDVDKEIYQKPVYDESKFRIENGIAQHLTDSGEWEDDE